MAKAVSTVFFREENSNLDALEQALIAQRFPVTREGARIVLSREGGPSFTVVHMAGPSVQAEAAKIGSGTEHASEMNACNAKFEIGIADLDAALDEINTLMEVQGALQDATRGYLYNSWNGVLTKPWVS
ncbi:MAG: hypothetical protein AAF938_11850 [Myxococcota bacterium]